MTVSTAFAAGVAFMLLIMSFVAGGLLVFAAVALPLAIAYVIVRWAVIVLLSVKSNPRGKIGSMK